MPEPDFHVDITDQSVNVRLNVSERSPKTRFYACILFVALVVLGICELLFLSGKHGKPSMWQNLSSSPTDSGGFIVPLVILLCFPVLAVLLLWRYTVSAYPSDETFHCDRSTLTLSRVRWLDIHNNHWNTRSYLLADIRDIRYRAVARTHGTSIYGLRFTANGSKQRVLPGLKPRDADKVLNALKAFGADVPEDPTLSRKLEQDASSKL